MLATALVLGFLITYGSQDVLAFNTVTFSSISQCGSFNVSFSGGQAPLALPLTLTILPFNSTNPLFIPIPANAWDSKTSTGAAITFVPYAAGTTFVASLDDADGQPTGQVSKVISISPSDNTACLPAPSAISAPPFVLDGPFLQCEPFNVSYSTAAPFIRTFRPSGGTSYLNSSSQSTNSSTFIMDVRQGKEVVMLFDDGQGNRQTTPLTTVGGDSTSADGCLQRSNRKMANSDGKGDSKGDGDGSRRKQVLSR